MAAPRMRAVIYCRVSTDEQTKNLSLSTQEKLCREYCRREGYDVDEVFVDPGESAKTTNRPDFLRLLAYCRTHRGRLHAVVVHSLTRFSRNNADHHAIAALLRGIGITLRSVTEPIDDSPAGRFMEAVLAGMAQFDNDVRSARTVAGMKAAIERGRWVWQAPVGYRNQSGSPSLVPDPDAAPLVRRAFELYAGGLSAKQALARITGQGLRTKKGGQISEQSFDNMLRNPVYMGLVRAKAWKEAQPGDFEPIITSELFARVQQRLRRKQGTAEPLDRHRQHPDFPLRRFVRCGHCNTVLTGSLSTGRFGRRYGFYHCRKGHVRATKAALEQAFVDLLDQTQPTEAWWRVLRGTVIDEWREETAASAATRRRLERRIAELRSRLQRVEDLFIHQQAIDRETYHAQRDRTREDLTLAQIELNDATLKEIDVQGILDSAEHVLMHSRALWVGANVEHRQRLQWALFPTGLTWTAEGFGTAVTGWGYLNLAEERDPKSSVASPMRPTWNHIVAWLQSVAAAA